MNFVLCIVFSNLGLGGVQTKIIDIVNYVGKNYPGVTVHIVLRKEGPFTLRGKIINRSIIVHNFEHSVGSIKSPFLFTLYILFILWKIRPSATLVFLSPFALPVLLARRILFWRKNTVVINEDNFTSGIINTYSYPLLNSWGIRLFYPLADSIIVPTRAVKQDLISTYKVPADRISVIYNWTSIHPKRVVQRDKKYDLLYIGRLAKTKRVHLVIEMIKNIKMRYQNIVLCITGDGDERDYLKKLVRKWGLLDNVLFHNATLHASEEIARSKIYVLASQYKAEGYPVAMLEAMKIGTPVLSYDFAGVREIVEDRYNGMIFRSQGELMQKTIELLQNNSLRRRVSMNAKRTVSTHCSGANIQKYIQLLGL